MARSKEFDRDEVLDSAIEIFREHGYEGSSTVMLVRAMGISKQSTYDTFGDKWKLYCSAVQRYVAGEVAQHLKVLREQPTALAGLEKLIERVILHANHACLGVSSICEFGKSRPELNQIHDAARPVIQKAIVERICQAQEAGEIAADLDPNEAAGFITANIAAIRIAARGGADFRSLTAIGQMTIRALKP
ncbi:TetR/AcrR family transcriptional regulator [Microbulbifer hainanensis]|uniref:TetR/AcrR family transcriptional regulator n=1 Tax=Microbulbifer hainanensis TaxID=2735675 RepID=UPI0018684529|nr:TetR/AcrR family transcriptional regulator [Microbulbifer hainanensis]